MTKHFLYAVTIATAATVSSSPSVAEDTTPQRGQPVEPYPGGRTNPGAQPAEAPKAEAAKAELSKSEKDFLMESAKSGMMELKIGQLAAKQGSRDEVKKFGQKLIDEHQKMTTDLTALAKQKDVTLPADIDKGQQKTIDRLTKKQGTDFDRTFLSEIVSGHDKSISDFQKQAKDAKDTDVRSFAANHLPALLGHYGEARDLKTKLSVAHR